MLKNIGIYEKWETCTVVSGIWQETWQSWKIRHSNTVGPGIWRENWLTSKMRNSHVRTWNMGRNTEKRAKWETHTLGTGIWQKQWKTWKMRNTHCRTWNMARKVTNEESETHTLEHLYYDRKTEKRGTWDTHNEGPGKWQETVKNLQKEKGTL
jgi:hypothetical protein